MLVLGLLVAAAVVTPPPFGHGGAAWASGRHALRLDPNGLKRGARELPNRRGRFSKTYRNPDGTRTTSLFSEPVNYRDAHGRWRSLESRFVPVRGGAYAWRNAANRFQVAFKESAADPDFYECRAAINGSLCMTRRRSIPGSKFSRGLSSNSASTCTGHPSYEA